MHNENLIPRTQASPRKRGPKYARLLHASSRTQRGEGEVPVVRLAHAQFPSPSPRTRGPDETTIIEYGSRDGAKKVAQTYCAPEHLEVFNTCVYRIDL